MKTTMPLRGLLTIFLLCASPAHATDNVLGNNKQPISIEAATQLEWLRAENKYRAVKDVVITQGDTIIRGDNAEALYDPARGTSALTIMTVTGHVIITQNGGNTIHADSATYDTTAQTIVLRGKNVTMDAPQIKVVAGGDVVYHVDERKVVAAHNATITQDNQKLQARKVTAWFSPDDNTLQRAMADGDVIVTQKAADGVTSIARGQHGNYDAVAQKITMTTQVTLARGGNIMTGAHAVVDLKTGNSQLLSDGQSGGRVQALFDPGNKDGKALVQTAPVIVPVIKPKGKTENAYAVDPVGIQPDRVNGVIQRTDKLLP